MALREQQRTDVRSLARTEEDRYAGLPEGELVDGLDDGALPGDIILAELRPRNGTNAQDH